MSQSDYQHKARKRFGQNFLQDAGIIDRIVRAIAPNADNHVVEIGPGQGAITEGLVASGTQLDVIELDRDLIPLLKLKFGLAENFSIHQGDALNFNFAELENTPLKVVGNLPYNISTPVIFHLLNYRDRISDMVFMLQKEVVDRLGATPGNKTWGRLGVMAQYYCSVQPLFEVPPECFSPRPKVQSAVVKLRPHAELPHPAKSEKHLDQVVKAAFNQRRKTLRNSLKQLLNEEQIRAAGVDPDARVEKLGLADFVALSNQIIDAD